MAAGLGVLLCAVVLFYRDEVLAQPLAGLVDLWVGSTFALLRAFSENVTRSGSEISAHGQFAFEIYYRCTGILPSSALAVAVLSARARPAQKLAGIAMGIPALLAVNQLRLIHLFWTGVHEPRLFDLLHDIVWPMAVVLALLTTWLTWRQWVASGARDTPPSAAAGGVRA